MLLYAIERGCCVVHCIIGKLWMQKILTQRRYFRKIAWKNEFCATNTGPNSKDEKIVSFLSPSRNRRIDIVAYRHASAFHTLKKSSVRSKSFWNKNPSTEWLKEKIKSGNVIIAWMRTATEYADNHLWYSVFIKYCVHFQACQAFTKIIISTIIVMNLWN